VALNTDYKHAQDRVSVIHDAITEWQIQDAQLTDNIGFLEYLKTQDIGQFPVVNQKKWMEYLRTAQSQRITVAEMLFNYRRVMIGRKLVYKRDSGKKDLNRIFVVDEEQRKELEELDERMKSYDPARVKRKGRGESI